MVLHTFLAIINSTMFTAKQSSCVIRTDGDSVQDQSSSDRQQSHSMEEQHNPKRTFVWAILSQDGFRQLPTFCSFCQKSHRRYNWKHCNSCVAEKMMRKKMDSLPCMFVNMCGIKKLFLAFFRIFVGVCCIPAIETWGVCAPHPAIREK